MSVSEEAAAALRELHGRLKSLEDTVQGSVEKWHQWRVDKVGPHRTAGQHKWSSE